MRAVTTSGVVVMNLLLPGASFFGGDTHFTPLSVPSSLPGIEQSLSVRATEAENIYEDPDCVRQVTNLHAFKWPLMTFWTLSFLPLSPLHRFSPPLVLCAPLCFFPPPPCHCLSLRAISFIPCISPPSPSPCRLLFIKPVFCTLPSQQAPPEGSVYMVSYCVALPTTHTHAHTLARIRVCLRSCDTPISPNASQLCLSLLLPPPVPPRAV